MLRLLSNPCPHAGTCQAILLLEVNEGRPHTGQLPVGRTTPLLGGVVVVPLMEMQHKRGSRHFKKLHHSQWAKTTLWTKKKHDSARPSSSGQSGKTNKASSPSSSLQCLCPAGFVRAVPELDELWIEAAGDKKSETTEEYLRQLASSYSGLMNGLLKHNEVTLLGGFVSSFKATPVKSWWRC